MSWFYKTCECVAGYCTSDGFCDLCDIEVCNYHLFGFYINGYFIFPILMAGLLILLKYLEKKYGVEDDK